MKFVLAISALVVLVLGAGCGGKSTLHDPFVGTWRPIDGSGSLVIAKPSGGYQAFMTSRQPALTMGPILLQRHGNQLVFPAQKAVGRMTFTYHPSTGRLTDYDGVVGIDFERVSNTTSHPMPQPQNPSPDATL